MQSNIHLAVADDNLATKALAAAFEHDVTDIIAFDYWSNQIDETKMIAREQAIKAAQKKSHQMFAELFDVPPAVINVQEMTTTRYPQSLYRSFVNVQDQNVTQPWRRSIPLPCPTLRVPLKTPQLGFRLRRIDVCASSTMQ